MLFRSIGTPVTLPITTNSGLNLTYVNSTPTVCSLSGVTLTGNAPGLCSITFSQAGNADWTAVKDVSIFLLTTYTIPQTISVTAPDYLAVGASSTLAATASPSGYAVTYTNATPTVCSLVGTTVKSLTQGVCTINLSQAGDYAYSSVSSVATIASAPTIFASAYKSNGADFLVADPDPSKSSNKRLTTNSSTLEGGTVTTVAGGDWDSDTNWNNNNDCWDANWCQSTVASDGLSWAYTQQAGDRSHRGGWNPSWGWDWPITALTWKALGLQIHIGAPTTGVQTTTETTLQIKLATNTEWYQGNHKARVQMTMAQTTGETCSIVLQSDISPTAATSSVWVSLSGYSSTLPYLSISNACGQTGLTVQSVLQSHPIAEVSLQPAPEANNDNGTNITITSPAADWPKGPAYQTRFTVGAITLQ